MILPFVFLAGAAFGWYRAHRRGGQLLDKLQYAVAHGLAAFLVVLVVSIVSDRIGLF